jgi:hypothetical protein
LIFLQNLLAFQLLESDRCGDRQSAERKDYGNANIHHRRTEHHHDICHERRAGASGLVFSSQKELAKLAAEWPVGRFVEIWNGFAGTAPFGELKPVKKFTDRKVAVGQEAVEMAPPASEEASLLEVAEPAETATVLPQVPDVAPEVAAVTTDANPALDAPAVEQPATRRRVLMLLGIDSVRALAAFGLEGFDAGPPDTAAAGFSEFGAKVVTPAASGRASSACAR